MSSETIRTSELPAPEGSNGFLERGSLIRLLRRREQRLVRDDGEIDGIVVVLGAGETRGVIGEVGLGQIVSGKALRHLLPARDALARVGLGERPQVPRRAVIRIGGNRARREITDDLRTRAYQPVMVGESDNRPRIVGALGHRALEPGKWISQRLRHAGKVSRPRTEDKDSRACFARRGSNATTDNATTDNATTVNSKLKKNAWTFKKN